MNFLIEICENSNFLEIVYVITKVLNVIFFVIPIILIVMVSFDFFKSVIANSEDNMKKTAQLALKRILYAVVIFLIPSIVNFTMNLLGDAGVKYADCLTNATADKIKYFKQIESANLESNNTSSNTNNNSSGSSKQENNTSTKTVKTTITLDRSFVAIDNSHYNTATLTATVKIASSKSKKVTWTSSNTNIVKVTQKGVVTAVAKKSGTVTITATTSDGKKAKCKVTVIRQMYKKNEIWQIDDEDYSNQVKESYFNNAELLCKRSNAATKWSECTSKKYVYYTGSPHNGTLKKHTMQKKTGVSATNYIIFVSSKKQTLTLLKKTNGNWKVVKSGRTSTAPNLYKGHYRFDFYLGANYYDGSVMHTVLYQFWERGNGSDKLNHSNQKEEYYAHRAVHPGGQLGYPHSAGCARLTKTFYNWLENQVKNKWGTRIIYY